MNAKLFQLRWSGLVFLGLFGACSTGDVNFPDIEPVFPPGPAGTVELAEISYDVAEGQVVNIFVNRSGGNSGSVSVDYATADGTATGGSDYTAANGTLTWGNGTGGNKTISIPITDDNTAENTESFTLTLSNVFRATLGAKSSTTVNIIDNDVAAVKDFGPITALNSATVNGIRYETNATSVNFNGLPANVTDLRLGQFVAVEGEVNFSTATGIANEIDYSASVIGPVESIDATLKQLVVLGQTVLTNTDTVFDSSIDPDTYAGLMNGARTQISGYRNADGEIVATRIEFDTKSTGVQLIGTVSGLDLANMSFAVDRLGVDYSNAVVMNLPIGMPTDGQSVFVRGSLTEGILVVSEIASIDDLAVSPGE